MDNSISQVLIFLLLTILCLSSLASTTARVIDGTTSSTLLQKACNRTEGNNDFCVEVLGSDPRTKKAKNLADLTIVALDISTSNSTVTKKYIEGKIKNKSTLKPNEEGPLKQCLNWYEGVVGSFSSALGEVEEKEYETANYDSFIAGEDARNCEQILINAKIKDLSISSSIFYVQKFSMIAVTFTDLLDRNTPP